MKWPSVRPRPVCILCAKPIGKREPRRELRSGPAHKGCIDRIKPPQRVRQMETK